MRRFRPRRQDANHHEIVDALRRNGCVVEITSDVGRGFPDCVVKTRSGTVLMVEIKDGTASPSQQQLTADELKFSERWGAAYVVVRSEDDARRAAMR